MEKAQFRLEIDLMSFHEVFYMKSQLVIASSKALSIINKRMQHFVIFPYSSFTLFKATLQNCTLWQPQTTAKLSPQSVFFAFSVLAFKFIWN